MINNLFKLLKPVFQKGAQQPVATAQTKSNRPPTSKVNDEKANDLYALILNNQKKKLVLAFLVRYHPMSVAVSSSYRPRPYVMP